MTTRFQPPPRQIVIWGRPAAEALEEALAEHWVGHAVVVTNTSLAGDGGYARQIAEGLGKICTNFITGLRQDAPRGDVVRVAGALRSRGTEALIAIGGGSVVEAAKAARICLTNNVGDVEDIDRLRLTTTAASPRPYLFSIPTTLSGAEFTAYAGVTDERTGVKEAFHHTDLAPDVVILDPEATLTTPQGLWLSTGVRAIDHGVESFCAPDAMPMSDASAIQGLRLLMRALPQSHRDPADLAARQACQVGAWLTIQASRFGVGHGASHGIGHALSAVTGMAHGLTSCVMLPHVLRFNASVNAARQRELAEVLGQPDVPLAELIAGLIKDIGQATRLRDVNVAEGDLAKIAAVAVENPRLARNPRPMSAGDVLGLLQAAW